jgi:ABC-type sugar transport system ATPase subunit
VLDLIRELKAQDCAVILISHRLEDVYEVGDRVVVLRQGRKVADRPVSGDLHKFREEIVAYMVGAKDDFGLETVQSTIAERS